MKLDQLALITFTIRDHIKTPEDFRRSMHRLASIGYRAVQISGMAHDVMLPEEIAKVCAENGLSICATHEPSDLFFTDPDYLIDRLHTLGCEHTAYPFPKGLDADEPADWKALIEKLNAAGARFREAGLTLSYHNHALEFTRYGGKTALEHIYDGTAAENLKGELDTYWVQLGGGNPVEWCRKLDGRLPMLHLKDVGVRNGKTIMHEIGSGNLDFKPIVQAAEEAGCEWFIVEQDTCPGDPFDSLKMSFDYIKEHLISDLAHLKMRRQARSARDCVDS